MEPVKYEIRKSIKARLIRKYRAGLIKKKTQAELVFKDILNRLGVDYIFQAGFLSDKSFYIVDFYIKSPYKLIVEIDDASHRERKKKIYDKQKTGYLIRCGFKVLKFSDEGVLSQRLKVERQLNNCLNRLKRLDFKKEAFKSCAVPPAVFKSVRKVSSA